MPMNKNIEPTFMEKFEQAISVLHLAEVCDLWLGFTKFKHVMMHEEETNSPIGRSKMLNEPPHFFYVNRIRKAMMHRMFGKRHVMTGRVICYGKKIGKAPNDKMRWRENIPFTAFNECSEMEVPMAYWSISLPPPYPCAVVRIVYGPVHIMVSGGKQYFVM